MRTNHLLLNVSALLASSFLGAQTTVADSATPYDLTPSQWENAEKRWKRKNIDATLFLADSTKLVGQILIANDSTVTVWKGEGLYSPLMADSLSVEIPLENVDSVYVNGRFMAPRPGLRGLLIGAGVGGAIGVPFVAFGGKGHVHPAVGIAGFVLGIPIGYGIGKYNAHKRYEKKIANLSMREYALFTGGVPTDNNIDAVAKKSSLISRAFPKKLISLIAHAGVAQVPFQFGPVQKVYPCIGMGIGVHLMRHWSVEASGSFFKADASFPGNGQVIFRTMRWRNYNVTANYSVFRTDRLAQRMYQVTIGAGYTYASIGNLAEVRFTQGSNSAGNRYSFNTTVHGFHLHAKAQVFAGKCLSFFVLGHTTFLPSITLPECKVVNPWTGEMDGLDETVAKFSWSGLSFGMQYYFRKK